MVGEELPCKVWETNKESLHDTCTRTPILLKPRKRLLSNMDFTLPSAFRSAQRESFRPSWSSSRKRINRPTSMSFMSCKALDSSLGGFWSANKAKSNNARR